MLALMRKGRLVLALAALAGACSSFGADDQPPAPGGGDGGDAGTTSDASVTPDGGSAFVPCSARPANDPAHFCDDFDGPGNVAFKWLTRVSDGGTLGETDAALSAPRALVASLGAGNAQTYAIVARKKAADLVTAGKTRITLSFALRIDSAPYPAGASGFTSFASAWFETPECNTSGNTKQRSVALTIQPNGDVYFEVKGFKGVCTDAGAGDDFLSTKVPFKLADLTGSGFHRFSLEVAHGGCANEPDRSRAIARIDGVASECQSLEIDPFTKLGTFETQLGPGAFAGTFGDSVFVYDDVSVDFD